MRMSLLMVSLASVGFFPWTDQGSAPAEEAKPPRRFEWQTATPESQGMSGKKLDAAVATGPPGLARPE